MTAPVRPSPLADPAMVAYWRRRWAPVAPPAPVRKVPAPAPVAERSPLARMFARS